MRLIEQIPIMQVDVVVRCVVIWERIIGGRLGMLNVERWFINW